MNKENVKYIHNGALPSHEEERNYVICRKMDGTGEHTVWQNKPDSKCGSYAEFKLKNKKRAGCW
jgi:hypothetical protein